MRCLAHGHFQKPLSYLLPAPVHSATTHAQHPLRIGSPQLCQQVVATFFYSRQSFQDSLKEKCIVCGSWLQSWLHGGIRNRKAFSRLGKRVVIESCGLAGVQ